MNDFRTELIIHNPTPHINIKNKIITVGSCFSDAIGTKLLASKFETLINPFGVIFNPVSIHHALYHALNVEKPSLNNYVEHEGVFSHYDFHSKFSDSNSKSIEKQLTEIISHTHQFLRKVSYLIITYGTAWVFERKDTKHIVANCHKVESEKFNKRLLSQDEIIKSFTNSFNDLKKINPSIKVILTVSPVRHIKDTIVLNSVSKSLLRVACHHLTQSFSDVEYFPAYEIMMDDLRDYRFYKEDMLHPTAQAENYIWKKFIEKYMDEQTKNFIQAWNKILPALQHKPFRPATPGHQIFVERTIQKLLELKEFVNVDEEIRLLLSQIK